MQFKLPVYENILRIHDLALSLGGGLEGILHPDRIEAALQRPQSYMNYDDGCDIHLVCAILLHSLACDHPFTEGNKRTALLTILLTYQVNDVDLHITYVLNKKYTELVLWVVNEKPNVKEIAPKLKKLAEEFEPSLLPSLLQGFMEFILNRGAK